jgi:hypothetical protein
VLITNARYGRVRRAHSPRAGGRLPRWAGRERGEMRTTGRRVRPATGSVGRAGSCGSCPRRSGVRGGAARSGCGQWPQARFSLARRTISSTSSSPSGGRPGDRAWSTSWSRCGGASAAAFRGSRSGAGASLPPASGTMLRVRPDRTTRAAASDSPGAALRPPGGGPIYRHSLMPTIGPAALARTDYTTDPMIVHADQKIPSAARRSHRLSLLVMLHSAVLRYPFRPVVDQDIGFGIDRRDSW